jgi:hypothetical protein
MTSSALSVFGSLAFSTSFFRASAATRNDSSRASDAVSSMAWSSAVNPLCLQPISVLTASSRASFVIGFPPVAQPHGCCSAAFKTAVSTAAAVCLVMSAVSAALGSFQASGSCASNSAPLRLAILMMFAFSVSVS